MTAGRSFIHAACCTFSAPSMTVANLPVQLIHRGALRIKLLLRDDLVGEQAGETPQVNAGVLQLSLIFEQSRFRLAERNLVGPRVDQDQQIAFLTSCPSWNATCTSCPSTLVLTVTVLKAVTLPNPVR
jgi:hypothetical protein